MKKFSLLLLSVLLFSCVSVRFPSEINVHVSLPKNMTEEHVDKLVDKIPPTIGQRKIKTKVEVNTKEGKTIKEEKTEESYNQDN